MKAPVSLIFPFIVTIFLSSELSLTAQTVGQLKESQVRADVAQCYRAYRQGEHNAMKLTEEESEIDFGPLIRSGNIRIEEGFFSSSENLEAMALFQDGQPVGPEWGKPTSLLAHYTCVRGSWNLTKVETWCHNLNMQDVDADGIQELWVHLTREGLEAGSQIQSLLSYAGGTWNTLWESMGEDRRPHTDFDTDPPQADDLLAEIQTAEFKWISGEPKPVMFVRRERSVCKMPICRSAEELETSVDWVRMKFEGGRYIPMHQ
jgi:hypothetical protein